MSSIQEILSSANKYLIGHNKQAQRFNEWKTVSYPVVLNCLVNIRNEIISKNDYFKSNLFLVEGSPATGIYIKSGKMPVPTTDNNNEEGFEIRFEPLYNAKIHVYVNEHCIEGNRQNYHTIEVVDNPLELTEQKIYEFIKKGIDIASNSSMLFIGDDNI